MIELIETKMLAGASTVCATSYGDDETVVVTLGDCLETLKTIPDGAIKLVVTSPPYNLNKSYEDRAPLDKYLSSYEPVVSEIFRVLHPQGSVCWQVGNYVAAGEVFPLDIFYYPMFKDAGFKLRNRIIWCYEHGLHATKRFSGRYETILWLTKSELYTFNLDPVRVPSKYPGKRHWRGEKKGLPSGNPSGKNPSDIWRVVCQDWEAGVWNIPNVKASHLEKTAHPCQFPIELVERCVLALTDEDDWVLDPFCGAGSALLAAIKHSRRAIGCEKEEDYIKITYQRLTDLANGRLRYRPLEKPVYQPTGREKVAQVPQEWLETTG